MTFCSCGREREENAAYTERYLVRNAVLAGEADEVGGACHASGCRFNVYNAHDVSAAQYTTTVERVSTRGAGHFKMLQRCRGSTCCTNSWAMGKCEEAAGWHALVVCAPALQALALHLHVQLLVWQCVHFAAGRNGKKSGERGFRTESKQAGGTHFQCSFKFSEGYPKRVTQYCTAFQY